MKEKEKKKAHPFAGHLRPSEEVLWMSPQAHETSRWFRPWIWAVILLAAVAMLASPMIGVPGDRTPAFEKFAIVLTLTVLSGSAAAVIGLIIFLFKKIVGTRAPERIYAVTNERLLYRSKKVTMDIPLEAVPSISMFLGQGTKGTFSFGAFFPMWPDVEDAVTVKHLIDDAQKQRIKEINA